MHEVIAKIESTSLGYGNDHGIFETWLNVTYGGSGQGIGGYALDTRPRVLEPGDPGYNPDKPGQFGERIGTAYGCEWIIRTIRACGVSTWEQVKGRTIIVLKADDSWSARVVGIKNLPTEPGEAFIFADLKAEMEEHQDA